MQKGENAHLKQDEDQEVFLSVQKRREKQVLFSQ